MYYDGMVYHSALKKELEYSNIWVEYKGGKNSVFLLDIIKNQDEHRYLDVDIIYSEPAWKDGYSVFQERAGVSDTKFENYVEAINNLIKNTQKPVVLILGAKDKKKYLTPESEIKTSINGYPAFACGWGINLTDLPYQSTNYDIIKSLALTFNKVWDFSCGYGNTGRIFKENNKNFILTDINKKCIGYVVDNILGEE